MNSTISELSTPRKENGGEAFTMASPSIWTSQGNFMMKAANFQGVSKKKKLSFTPQPMTSSCLPLNSLEIISFDEIVSKNSNNNSLENISFSNNNDTQNKNLLDCFKIFDEEYANIVKSIYSFSRQISKHKSCCTPSLLTLDKKEKNKNEKNYRHEKVSSFDATNPPQNTQEIQKDENEGNNNQKEDVKKMTNIQEISDFYEYTKNCMHLISEMASQKALNLDKYPLSKEQYINLPFINQVGIGKDKKRLAIFDLDETLIHCELNPEKVSQTTIDVMLPNKKIKSIGLNVRPHWKEEILKIKKKYFLIIYTASHQSYADSVLNYLDPKKEIFDLRLYRNNCTIINFENKIYYIKDLRIFKDVSLKDMVIIDNSVLSFAFHLENGIPILPYYNGEEEIEMQNLCKLLLKLAEYDDIKTQLNEWIELKSYGKKILKKNKVKTSSNLQRSQENIKTIVKNE